MTLSRRDTLSLLAAAAGAPFLASPALAYEDVWAGLVTDAFGGKAMEPTEALVSLEAPYRAEDAAIVPMTIRTAMPAGDARTVKKITLVIDRNPAPVAAVFEIGADSGVAMIETRVRINEYTKVHAVAELSDGALYVTEKFVKAAGGCSAPAVKDQTEAMASLGKMKFRQFPVPAGAQSAIREAQLFIRHPNNSGFQRETLTNLYIRPRFVDDIAIKQGEDLILRVTGGISLSEDPNLRFAFRHNGAAKFSAAATDTDSTSFSGEWAAEAAGSAT
jgi:sulfur-oxidizing protein SoxY